MSKSPYVDPSRRGNRIISFVPQRRKIDRSPGGVILLLCWGITVAGFLFAVVLLFDIFSNESITHEHVLSVKAESYMDRGVKTLTDNDIIRTREGNSIKVSYQVGAIVEGHDEIWVRRTGFFHRPLEIYLEEGSSFGNPVGNPVFFIIAAVVQVLVSGFVMDFRNLSNHIYYIGIFSLIISIYLMRSF